MAIVSSSSSSGGRGGGACGVQELFTDCCHISCWHTPQPHWLQATHMSS
jgi:hypothetical protein